MTVQLDSDTVALYLTENPDFFEQHLDLLSKIKITSPLGNRTVSLQERQMEILREKIRGLELRFSALVRVAQENEAVTVKFHHWSRSLLTARNDVDLPHLLITGLQTIFSVPQATLRIWGTAPEYSHTWFSASASADVRIFANGLDGAYCGPNNDFEAASWLDDASTVKSVALLPLRKDNSVEAFGLLVLGSPDPERFSAGMATDFLKRISETTSAALTCLLD